MNLAEFIDEIQTDPVTGKQYFTEICNYLLFGAERRHDLFSDEDFKKCQSFLQPALRPMFDIHYLGSVQQIDHEDNLALVESDLRHSLMKVLDLARANQLNNWVNVFTKCISLLDAEPENNWFITLLTKTGYSKAAIQVLTAAFESDVFGTMGSWNDVVCSDMEEYNRLTANLFQTVQQSVRTAINSNAENTDNY